MSRGSEVFILILFVGRESWGCYVGEGLGRVVGVWFFRLEWEWLRCVSVSVESLIILRGVLFVLLLRIGKPKQFINIIVFSVIIAIAAVSFDSLKAVRFTTAPESTSALPTDLWNNCCFCLCLFIWRDWAIALGNLCILPLFYLSWRQGLLLRARKHFNLVRDPSFFYSG